MIHEKIKLFSDRGVNNNRIRLKAYIKKPLDGNKRPAMIILPGGGFVMLSRAEGEPVALAYLAEGYQAFVCDYSVYGTSPDATSLENILGQIKESLDIIAKRADEWSIDVNRIYLTGFSAGANLAALYSNRWKEMGGIRPCGVVLSYGVFDHIKAREWAEEKIARGELKISDSDAELLSLSDIALFGHPADDEDRKSASPVYFVSEDNPPAFIWHTFGDNLVSPLQSVKYAEKLYQVGVPCELHVFETGDHALSLATEECAYRSDGINDQVAQWFRLALNWLDTHK